MEQEDRHICWEQIAYIQYMVKDSTPINAAIVKTEKELNVVLKSQCCFDAQATSLSISVCVLFLSWSFTPSHILYTDTPHPRKCKNIPMFRTDPHFSLRQLACLAFEWTWTTSHVYMMTNPTFNLLCLFAVRTNFFYLINDPALKATKCWMNRCAH